MLWREGSKLRPRITDFRGAGGNIFAEIRVPSKETGFTLLQDFSSQAGDLLRHRLVIRKFQGRALEYRQAAGCRVPCIWGRWFQFLFWRRFWDRIQQLTREGLRFVNLHGNASIHSSFLRSPPTDGPRGWSRALLSGIHLGPFRPPSPSPGPVLYRIYCTDGDPGRRMPQWCLWVIEIQVTSKALEGDGSQPRV